MSKPSWSAKTGIEAEAVEDAFKKDYAEHGSSQGASDDNRRMRKLDSARREAVGEIKRETRGKAPEAYAKGGKVSSASKRADGIAIRGKTRA